MSAPLSAHGWPKPHNTALIVMGIGLAMNETRRPALWPPSRPNAPPWPPKAAGSKPRRRQCYVAELVGADTDSERTIRWLIALMVLRCDPRAIALTAGFDTAINHIGP
jgi:hypothetical protein